ncbi:hypothetical protein OHA25_02865 [Nonomuraea sp. NBC_00507]|uniref:hypothetical protein n=1 Tax=Nonomuraea sp. NBC_00507 TaxID=2976002 RepID=UPI002E180360
MDRNTALGDAEGVRFPGRGCGYALGQGDEPGVFEAEHPLQQRHSAAGQQGPISAGGTPVFDHLHGLAAAALLGRLGEHVPGKGEFGEPALGLLDALPYEQIDGGGWGHRGQRAVDQAESDELGVHGVGVRHVQVGGRAVHVGSRSR